MNAFRHYLAAIIFLISVLSILAQAAEESTQKLLGSWIRPDGGYELRVLAINEDGSAKAEYYNPSPISVAEAKVALEAGQPTLSVKFEQGNYAGSSYALKFQEGRLVGKYHQAMMGQIYEVFFERKK